MDFSLNLTVLSSFELHLLYEDKPQHYENTCDTVNCRSISSLGGSAIESYGGNMTFTEKTAISALLGGTAESLGGGKFSNGAVTGAYVMMLNHLGQHGDGGDEKNRTGRKFYDEKGNQLANENIKGKETQIIVIPEEGIKEFENALAFAKKFGNFTEFNQIVAKYGVEYNYIIAGDQLFVNEKLTASETFLMAAHFAGEGFAMGYYAGKYYENDGLYSHYTSVFTAKDYWLERTKLTSFKPWWE
jgi:hypothetical protein